MVNCESRAGKSPSVPVTTYCARKENSAQRLMMPRPKTHELV